MSEKQEPYGKERLGPTGDFPQGKLSADDEGGINLGIGIVSGKIVLNFGTKPVIWLGFDAGSARKLATSLNTYADKLDAKAKVPA